MDWGKKWLVDFNVGKTQLVSFDRSDNNAMKLSLPIGLVKTESGFIIRSVETGLGRWTLVVAVISVDAYPFFWYSQT